MNLYKEFISKKLVFSGCAKPYSDFFLILISNAKEENAIISTFDIWRKFQRSYPSLVFQQIFT